MGDKSGATAQLERWSKEHSDDIDVMLALANNYLGMGRDADAIKQYQQVLKSSKDNLIAINNLAWHLRDSDPEQALSLAERAYAAAPESSTVMDTLAMILMKKGDNQKAQRLIERALSKYPDDSTLLYHHALILEKAGGKQAAEKELRKLLKLHKEFSERRDAEAMLKRIGSS